MKIFWRSDIYKCLFFIGLSIILYIYALTLEDLMVLYPIISTQYIWVAFLGMRLGEHITKWKLFGIMIIVTGVFLIGIV